VNVFRVGQYKSAVETFSRNDMSPAEREESLVWLNTVWGTYKSDVATAREFDASVLQAYADQAPDALRRAGGDPAKMALEARLVTSLKGRFEVEQRLAQITGPDEDAHSFVGVDLDSYLANIDSQQALSSGSRRKIGVIVASGEIVPGEQPPGMVGSDTLAAQLREANFDESVKAVVLRIDSPGGSVFASEVIRREVQALREAGKPVVASMSSLAASGGYYIAMDADRIIASPATLTGSIGVLAIVPLSSARWSESECTPTVSARRRCPASCGSTGRWATRRRTCCSRAFSAHTTISLPRFKGAQATGRSH